MWILILTLTSTISQGGHAITAVPGFTSEKSCMVAANAWVAETRDARASAYARALCVKA